MGSILINGHTYQALNKIYTHESEQFFHEQFVYAKHYRETHDNRLPGNTFWKYLIVKHDINPHRFDKYHPLVGHWIEQIPKPCPPDSMMCNSSVPEPSSTILLAGALIAFCVYKFFTSRKS